MNNLSINSRIIPKIYFKHVISNKTDNLYTLLNQSKKRNIILYKIFIKDMLISKLNRDIVKIIKKYYLDNACVFKDSKEIKNKVIICQITTEKQIQNIYKYNFTKYIYTVFNLVNKNEHYLKHRHSDSYSVILILHPVFKTSFLISIQYSLHFIS